MKHILAKAALTAALIAGAFSGTVTSASAQNLDIYVGPGHHRPPPPDYYGRPPMLPPGFRGRGCDPRQAEGIARDTACAAPASSMSRRAGSSSTASAAVVPTPSCSPTSAVPDDGPLRPLNVA